MEAGERDRTIKVLGRIPNEDWNRFLDSEEGEALQRRLEAARGALREAGALSAGAPRRPTSEVLDLLGHRLLGDREVGPWVRSRILENLAPGKWETLAKRYREFATSRAGLLHGNMTQSGRGSEVMAEHWHRGSRWAGAFCELAGLPQCLAERHERGLPDDEEIVPAEALPPLHDFQVPVYKKLRRLLEHGAGRAAMLSLPTGAGKTRVVVEALCDHMAELPPSRRGAAVALWIAQSDELLVQAWECIRQVWQVAPRRTRGAPARRKAPLRIVRLWGGRKLEDVDFDSTDEPTIFVAGIDQLSSWAKRHRDLAEVFPRKRLVAVLLDEAHSVLTHEYRQVLTSLRLRQQARWLPLADAPLVIGLTATPWRTRDEEVRSLRGYFSERLVGPEALGPLPVAELQRRGILAKVEARHIVHREPPTMSNRQLAQFRQFGELPGDYLEGLGADPVRNATILKRLAHLPKRSRTLVFACSIAHAEVLAMILDSYFGTDCAAVVSSRTPRAERIDVIERFRNGDGIRFLCNVGVLTTGFDAPRADSVCLTRPTASAIRYEQMVGRGLRGPKNGGTEKCTVLDVQDKGLPDSIQSYGRVLELWDRRPVRANR